MLLIKEIIQRVQSLYSKGAQSDDSRLSQRHIYSKLISLRSKYISQQAKKRQKLNQWNFQTLPCVEVIKVPQSLCPCVTVPGCDILRTKYPLPKPLSNLNNHLIQSVTSVDGNTIFSEIQWNEVKYKASSKYTSTKPDFFINDGYLYIIGLIQKMRHLKVITITGLFEDPLSAEDFPSICDCSNKVVGQLQKSVAYVTQTFTTEVITENLSVDRTFMISNGSNLIETTQTFRWSYPRTRIYVQEEPEPYLFFVDTYDCCGGSEIIEEKVIIDTPIYNIVSKDTSKQQEISYTEYYTEAGIIKSRVVVEQVPYVEHQDEKMLTSLTQNIPYEKEVCIDDCTSSLDKEFRVDSEFIDFMIGEAAEELVTFFSQVKEDLTNDSKDNTVEESK